MLKKKGILGFLLVVLFSFVVVEAKEALTAQSFADKMDEMGYDTYVLGDAATASPSDQSEDGPDEVYTFEKHGSSKDAQEELDDLYDESKGEKLTRSKTSSGNSSCVSISGEDEGEFAYMLVCRVDDTVIIGATNKESKVGTVKDVLSDLGYYSSSSLGIIIIIVLVVVVIGAIVAIVIGMSSKKKKNNMNMNRMNPNNGMGYNQPVNNGMNGVFNPNAVPPMGQNMNMAQPMNNGMNDVFDPNKLPSMNQNTNMNPAMNNSNPVNNGMNGMFNPNMNPPMGQNTNMAPPMNNPNPANNGMNGVFNPNMNPPMGQNTNMAPPMNNPNPTNNGMNNGFN